MSDEIKKGEVVAEGGSPLPGTIKVLLPRTPAKMLEVLEPNEVEVADTNYTFELIFNSKAQLIVVNHPSNLSLESVAEHIAVGLAFLAKEVRVAAEVREEEI